MRSFLLSLLALLLVCASPVLLTSPWLQVAVAQVPGAAPNYKVAEFPEPKKADRDEFKNIFIREMSPGMILNRDAQLVSSILQYQIGELTFPNIVSGGPSAMTTKRNEIRALLVRAGRLPSPDQHNLMNRLIIEHAMPLVVGNEYHPGTRYNLLYLVGSLDRVEREGATPPVPLPEGTAALLEVIKNDALPGVVWAAAFEQLDRHAEYEMTQPQRAAVVAAIKRFLADKGPPAKVDPVAWAWGRKRAANIVLHFADRNYAEVNDPALIQGLARLLADAKATPNARGDAALALGACDAKWLQGAGQTKEMVIATGDALKTNLRDCADPAFTRPMLANVLHLMICTSESLRKGETTTKGIIAALNNDAGTRAIANALAAKVTEYDGKLRKTIPNAADPRTTVIGPAQVTVMTQFLTEVEDILRPLGGAPIGNVGGQ